VISELNAIYISHIVRLVHHSMVDLSDSYQEHRSVFSHQLDFTDTENLLHEIVTLTNCMLKGPTLPDEDIWSTQATVYWNRTMRALKQRFSNRLGYRPEHHDILEVSRLKIRVTKRVQASQRALRVATTIQDHARRLTELLEVVYPWHNAQSSYWSCRGGDLLQGLQESTILQLVVLQNVVIPWETSPSSE
jgi:hypothetical protein